MRTVRYAAIFGAALILSSAVSAGEITGNGNPTALQGESWCRYSGLNDTPGQDGFDQTQNWGQLIALYGWIGDPGQFNPSNFPFDEGRNCNPTNSTSEPLRNPGSH